MLLLAVIAVVGGAAFGTHTEDQLIKYAKNLSVSRLGNELPDQPLRAWLTETLGHDAPQQWKVSDCEVKPPERPHGKDGPLLCVRVSSMTKRGYVRLHVLVGTTKRGIWGRPRVLGGFVGRGRADVGRIRGVDGLDELPSILRQEF